ncbi:Melanocyte protein PMEL 115 kDa melanosomal matrix protein [Triplophysa tibetana]|uniref:Melanocyte protein PMEL 115 kDa melanosomal matrix protein n=1 Tax=Triplophysa tibetana TaxID=1572043 RepID=A0A5A9ND34_9TELE|nr:Melanocyte protein PMEL 115 kDa melanosomal matrix protein [Triplophysa tibetana]
MKLLSRLLLLSCFSVTLTRHVDRTNTNSRLNPYQIWNTKQFPVWKHGDPRYKTSWRGGEVKFDVSNDAPTLTGAKITFTIDIVFPHNQKLRPDGRVVWAEKASINGTQFREGEPVYPEGNLVDVFPHAPLHNLRDKKPPYVFVWKTWGKYWQVCDGPSSSLTIATDDVPIGSFTMDVVIYHYRKRDKFIPIGYASTQFSITDQIPFSVSLTQVNDKDEKDQKFIQNRAVAFSITLHDPSQYLSQSDVTFNWDFGDRSGTVISRELTVTHTYLTSGSFRPRIVIQAAIPDPSCAPKQPTEANPTASIDDTPETTASLTEMMLEEDSVEDQGRVIIKRQAANTDDCVIYRYGSFSTEIQIIEGIESVQIVRVAVAEGFLLTEMERNIVDFTVTCQGSPPTEVCTVVSDADCHVPFMTICTAVSPSADCQLILRHSFNDSGIFCINVSMTNDDSLAVANARVDINIAGSRFASAGVIAVMLGILTMASVLGSVAYAYKRLKGYQKLIEAPAACQTKSGGTSSVPVLFWGLLNQQTPGHK